jgi:hypothetical protein
MGLKSNLGKMDSDNLGNSGKWVSVLMLAQLLNP